MLYFTATDRLVSLEEKMEITLDKRERIIQAAVEVFGAAGFDTASMADIAAGAEVGKGTLYLYFPSKEELFEEVYQRCRGERLQACGCNTERLSSTLEKLFVRLRNGTRWELAAPLKNRLVRAYLNHLRFNKKVRRVVDGQDTQHPEPILQQGVERGELRPMPVDLLAEMFVRFGSAVFYYIERNPEQAENEDLWKQIYASFCGCLGAADLG